MKAALFVCVTLVGCASNSGVVPMGHGSYMMAKQQATGFSGLGNLKPEILQEADAFCTKQGKGLRVTDVTETKPPYLLGNFPRVEVQFVCD